SMIAEALGMTKGALYKHYKNKQDIFDCIVERMYQIDNKRAKDYQVPESTIEVTPNAYRNTTIGSLITFTLAQYDFWVTDEFASNFRKMLILEQYRNLKVNMLYQKCLVNGPISYIEDIFNEMIEKGVLQECDTKQLAIEYYAPLFLLISVADAVENCWDLKTQLTTHVKQFVKKYIINEKVK
ncbi:TetR/AcrR family transcriptional regulator, partial [Clostridioides difficile]|nr:TetR/AcrR family transcriptional regulator [Clostridioides difficile]MBY2797237.1 TetR/AcrR family transcriptional regulator [Clostridioides difficile]